MIENVKELLFQMLSRQTIQVVTNNSLEGKVVVITGASKGIGKTTAEVLQRQGATVVLVSRTLQFQQTTHLLMIPADITKEHDCQHVVRETVKAFGRIDALINNAGMFSGRSLEETTLTEWRKSVALNLEAAFMMSKAVLPVMKRQKNGVIINIGSKISRKTNVTPYKVLYASTKYAVEGFSHALHNEVKKFGIRVVCLMPDTVNTHRSLKAAEYLSPYRIAQLIGTILHMDDVSFDSVVITSKYQSL